MTNLLYTNPIGDNINIEYNNIDKYLKNKKIIDARIEDYEKKYNSNKLQLLLWSSTSAIIILIALALLRKM